MNLDLVRSSNWYLEGFVGDSARLRHIAINTWPFRIGRLPDAAFCLPLESISKEHAEIVHDSRGLSIRDLNSRNGTFVNGNRIDHDTRIKSGDVLHFANVEFRLGNEATANAGATMQVDRSGWIMSLSRFERLFDPGAATPFFQPIIDLASGETCGYEVLARSRVDGLQLPKAMFDVAARLDMEGQLSRLFRDEGVRIGSQFPGSPNLFLNTHPAELADGDLVASLRELRSQYPKQPLTLEIHEAAITDPTWMREFHGTLRDLDIQLAYDDFGAGQARLIDLIEVPPDYLKFDICLVRDIHKASDPRRQMLETLVRMTHDLGVAVLAEGIEDQAEGEVCQRMGFDFAQGYYYGRPMPAGDILSD
jgi:EAL domain-containing protein (putative c-di-GMP-specific phosphodiesterase class I)